MDVTRTIGNVGVCVNISTDVQADVCHAYQVLKNGGMKDENIVVFMFDDIAHDPNNPRPGTIINHPLGADVYHGVPKVCSVHIHILSFFIQS